MMDQTGGHAIKKDSSVSVGVVCGWGCVCRFIKPRQCVGEKMERHIMFEWAESGKLKTHKHRFFFLKKCL